MQPLKNEDLSPLLAEHKPPCISLFLSTHRHRPDNQQNPIRFRNLLRKVEASLRETHQKREVDSLLEKFHALARDTQFWNYRGDGLAVLGSADTFHFFDLQRPVEEQFIVAERFHVKPLLRALQWNDRFQILCLSREEARLYEGDRDSIHAVELKDVPATVDEALGPEVTEPYRNVASYGTGGGGMHHGHGSKKDEVNIDRDRFFRVIDRAILEHHSRPSSLPLMLAAPAEYHAHFRKISRNPFLMAEGLQVNPEALSAEELRAQAWKKVDPFYHDRMARLIDKYRAAASRGLGSDDPVQVARAIMDGRVDTLFVEAEREITGRINPDTGRIEPGDLSKPDAGDVLDDLSEMAFRRKGVVVVVPAEQMPVATGVAAIYRF